MHPVLWYFVDAARRGFVVGAIEVIQRPRAFPDGEAGLNGFQDISFREHYGLTQAAP